MPSLPFRQVHLDFHTNGSIPGVGAKFDKKEFQTVLQESRINSITCFSKCHHGWSYHDTKVGRRHPRMSGELLARQIEACREIDVHVPIYLSAGWDELALSEHPEWRVIDRNGVGVAPFSVGWRGYLRWNSPYLDYLCRQIEEVATRWPDADGIFLDIVGPRFDYSDESLAQMKASGYNPENESEVAAWAREILISFYEKTTASARIRRRDMPIFHNGGHVHVGDMEQRRYNSHLELESLPTDIYGYDHFPLSARYAITTGLDFLGMTGKFHTKWGEFGGFKRPEALRYECESMIAHGARCSIGDQLHPSGQINRDTYSLIGAAYHSVEAKESWCVGASPISRIGILSTTIPQTATGVRNPHADEGAARMLLELHLPFVVLDRQSDWSDLDLVILPDDVRVDEALLAQIRGHLTRGGRILASGTSLLDTDAKTVILSEAGVRLAAPTHFDPDYLVATPLSADVPIKSPIVIHGGAPAFEACPGTRVLAARAHPYFNNTWDSFCSHLHAPDDPPSIASAGPAATLSADRSIAFFAHKIFTRYRLYGQPLYRDFVLSAIKSLLGGENALPVRMSNLPPAGRVTLMEQAAHRRYILHVLYAAPVLRGAPAGEGPKASPVEVIEGIPTIHDIGCSVRLPRRIHSARLVPEDVPLAFKQDKDVIELKIPKLTSHQMIEFSW